MAEPISNTVLLAKTAVKALSSGKVRKTVGWVIAGILSPIIVVVAIICGMLSGTANHNNNALELCFNGGVIGDIPTEYREHIESMRDSFLLIDNSIRDVNSEMEDGESLDTIRVKAIFYALFFGADVPSYLDHIKYVHSFVDYEERTVTVVGIETDTSGSSDGETYTVAIPILDMGKVYENIATVMGKVASQEDMANATEVYYRIKYGIPAPTYGDEFYDFIDGLSTSDAPFIGVDGFVEPVSNWRSSVTSEYGQRIHPISGKPSFHTGIDIGKAKGTPVYSVLGGTVLLVRYSNSGYGYHVMVDHGGGFVTLYAHNSKLLVHEGQELKAGEQIAEVGTTGNSTGNHLHFEIRIGGEKVNPRSYLPKREDVNL